VADDTVGWLALATSKSVVRRATVVAFIVGSILVVINHGDAMSPLRSSSLPSSRTCSGIWRRMIARTRTNAALPNVRMRA
jgi:hypothetical protein